MSGGSRLATIGLTAIITCVMAGCAATPSPSWPTSGPGPLSSRESASEIRGAVIDGIEPGITFTWGDLILYNEGTAAAVVDKVTLDGAPADLQLVGASALPRAFDSLGLMDLGTVPVTYQQTLAARPLLGSKIEPTSGPGWDKGVLLVFLLRSFRVGSIRVDAVTLGYHVGAAHYTATYQHSLGGCVGADMHPPTPCPYVPVVVPTSTPSGPGQ